MKNLWSEVWKGGMLFVTKSSLLFRWLWPYCDQNKLPSDILSYRLRIKRKSSKIWTNFDQDVDKNWAKPTWNFDVFYIRLLRLCEVKKDSNGWSDINFHYSETHRKLVYSRFYKKIWPRKVFTLCQNQMGYHGRFIWNVWARASIRSIGTTTSSSQR